jgi:hypothetical protein
MKKNPLYAFRARLLACLLLLPALITGSRLQAQVIKNNVFAACPVQGYIATSTYLTSATSSALLIKGGQVIDNSGNAYVMGGSVLYKLAPDGSVLWQRTGVVWNQESHPFVLENNFIYIAATVTNMSAVPNVVGPLASYTGAGTVELKINATTGVTVSAYTVSKTTPTIFVRDGAVYYAYNTTDNTLPVTDGSVYAGPQTMYAAKLNAAGGLVYGGYINSRPAGTWNTAIDMGPVQVANDGSFYVQFGYSSGTIFGGNYVAQIHTVRLNPSGTLAYNKIGSYRLNNPASNTVYGFSTSSSFFDEIYPNPFATIQFSGSGSYIKLDSLGNQVYSTPVAGTIRRAKTVGGFTYMANFQGTVLKVDDATGASIWQAQLPLGQFFGPGTAMDADASGNVWVLYTSLTAGGVTTNGSSLKGNADLAVTGFNSAGDIIFSSYLGGTQSDPGNTGNIFIGGIAAANGKVYIFSDAGSGNYPVTNTSTLGAVANFVWTVLDFNPGFAGMANVINGPSGSTCRFGIGEMLTGNKVELGMSTGVPLLYRSGTSEIQAGSLRYQWQQSPDNSTWTNINGANAQSYLPPAAGVSMYYRRLIVPAAACATVLSTSNVVQVTVNANIAPVVTSAVASGYNTCPGNPVNIGLNITGGTPPYIVTWDNTPATLSNMNVIGGAATATATPTQNIVYTAKITDAQGCMQTGQTPVMVYSAGPSKATLQCSADSVIIGNQPAAAGVAGVTYAWLPVTSLACATCPQTKGNAPGTYTLTMTVPVTGGGTCNTTMNDTIKTVAAPAANFAGPDVLLCSPAGSNVNLSTQIGMAANPGAAYTYTWAPGSYLATNNAFRVTMNLGATLPLPDPLTYFLTATQGNCIFVDSMKLNVLRADAGIDGCGPRLVGNPTDPTPGIAGKTYSWTRVDNGVGAAGFQSGANLTQRTVLVTSGTINTRFRVVVTDPASGNSCADTVLVTADCGCNNAKIEVLNPEGCPIYAGAGNPVRLSVVVPGYFNDNLVYEWTPAVGLNRYDSSIVTLVDGVNRIYTVTIRDVTTNAVYCTVTKEVNGVGWAFPAFTAKDTIVCPVSGSNTVVLNIGQATVAGYNYLWKGVGVSDTLIANPAVTVNSTFTSQQYTVKVTDAGTGCATYDTASVGVSAVVVNAGPDLYSCGTANATLADGVDSLTGYTYAWTPATTWMDGTDASWLHARIAIAGDADYMLTATNTATGCSASDIVHVSASAPATVPIASTSTTVCKGSARELSVPLYGSAIYTWTSSNVSETMPPATAGLNKITVAPQGNTTYSVAIAYGPGCTAITGSTVITVTDLSYVPAAHTGYCPTTNPATLSLGPAAAPTSGTAPYIYSWSPPLLVNTPAVMNTTVKIAPTVNTSYTLTITDATGCAASTTEVVSVVPGSKPVAGSSRSMCLGGTETLGDASNTGVTWQAVPPATTALLSSATAGAPVFTPVAAGTFTFHVQYSAGCVNPDTVVVTVNPVPALSASGATMCTGTNLYTTIGTTAVPGVSYQWLPVTGIDSPTAARTAVHATMSQNYSLTATDMNGCQHTVGVPVVVNSTVVPTVAVPALSLCEGTVPAPFLTTINGAAPPGGSGYQAAWVPPVNLASVTDIRPFVLAGSAGTYNYTVTVTDQTTGCAVQAPATANIIVCAIALPVRLTDFTAAARYHTALLNWTTGEEKNSAYFDVERSTNAKEWTNIGRVAASGKEWGDAYQFTDYNPGAALVYYRLKMTDQDGGYTYSGIQPVRFNADNTLDGGVHWFPNPTTGSITLQCKAGVHRLLVTDLTGKVLYERQQLADGAVCSLPVSMPQGVYIMITEANGMVQTGKLILIK